MLAKKNVLTSVILFGKNDTFFLSTSAITSLIGNLMLAGGITIDLVSSYLLASENTTFSVVSNANVSPSW